MPISRANEHLHEQLFELRAKAAPEVRQRVLVRMAVGGDVAERDRVIGSALDLAARRNPSYVAVDQ
jgi:hypothetical protein